MFANTNAPPAVTHSAIIYSLRCMVSDDIPLNQARYHCQSDPHLVLWQCSVFTMIILSWLRLWSAFNRCVTAH